MTAPHPSIQDVGERRRAVLLANIGLVLFPLMTIATILGFIIQTPQNINTAFIPLTITFLSAFVLARTRYYRLGSIILALGLITFTVFLAVTRSTPLSEILYSMLPVMFIAGIALFDQRGMWILFAATMIGMGMIFVGRGGMEMDFILRYIGLTASMAILSMVVVRFRDALERERFAELQTTNRELISVKNELEQRVQERTADINTRTKDLERYAHQMETLSSVAYSISAIQSIEQLLPTICRIVSERFGHYHTGIFLLDEQNEYAVLRATNSEGGRRMLERKYRLRVGAAGIVGYAAAHGESRVVQNVGADSIYFDSPDLPDTRTEAALPIKIGSQTIGILDVQSKESDAFRDEDIDILGVLANQIAIAIENARLFSQTKQALADSQSFYEQYIKQDWERFSRKIQYAGYRYDGTRTTPFIPSAAKPDQQTLQIPIKIRNLVVGYIHLRANNPLREWTEDELRLAQSAAERAGLAIENARLLGEAQRRAAKERTIGDIASKISASVNINSIMQTAVEELGRALPGSEVNLQFRESNK
jgi:GAF domain-containing protein